MIASLCELRTRLRREPEAHLAQRDLLRVLPYELGYELARQRWHAPVLLERISRQRFQDWSENRFAWTREMGCRQNSVGFARLFAKDELAAFDFFFDLYDAAIREFGHAPQPPEELAEPPMPLLEFILGDPFRNRPGMYLGSPSIDGLWAICSGYLWAERDLGITQSADSEAMRNFQAWVDARFAFARGQAWNRTLKFLALSSPKTSWDSFYDMFEIYQKGATPDSLSKTGEQMLASITNQMRKTNSSTTTEAVRSTVGATINRISPT